MPLWRRADAQLAAVALVYVVVQVALVPMDRYWAWDEAVYVSQVSGDAPAAHFSAHRARGIVALVAPVVVATDSILVLRLYLTILSGFALFLAYRPWLRVVTPAVVPLAAGIYCISWITVFHGSEVSPNPWVAVGAVAAAGYAAAWLWGQAPARALWAAGLWLAVVALLRPSDSVWLAVPLGVAAVLAGWRGWRLVIALLAGGVIGWLPWVVEAFARFSDPVQRLRIASAAARVDTFSNIALQLRLSDGAVACCFGRFREPFIPAEAVAWWLFFITFAVIAVLACTAAERRAAVLGSATAISMGIVYLFLTQFVYVRFLMPVYGLSSVAAAAGILAAYRGPVGRAWGIPQAVVLLGVSVLLSGLGYWHLNVLSGLAEPDARRRAVALAVAEEARERAGLRPPCYVVGVRGPQIAYALGCDSPGINRRVQLRDEETILERQAQGDAVAAFWRFKLGRRSFAHDWKEVRLRDVGQRGWRMYLPPDDVSARSGSSGSEPSQEAQKRP